MATPKSEQPVPPVLHVLQLTAVNYGALGNVTINCEAVNTIAGKNGAGKTTVLDTIESAFTPYKIAEPVRRGSEAGQISVVIGSPIDRKPVFTIERVFRGEDGDAVKIKGANGKQIPSQRAFLNELIGSGMAFDCLEFVTPRPGEKPETMAKRQATMLSDRIGLTALFAKIDEALAEQETIRRDARKDMDRAATQRDSIPLYGASVPSEMVDVQALVKTINAHKELTAQIATSEQTIADLKEDHKEAEQSIHALQAEYEKRLADAKAKAANLASNIDDMNGALSRAKKLVIESEKLATKAETDLNNANDTNLKVAEKKRRAQLDVEHAEVASKFIAAEQEIAKLKADKKEAVLKAKMPMEGLSFDEDDNLRFKGDLLLSLSTAQRIEFSCKLAMSDNPKARILLIRDAALVSEDIKQSIYAFAKEHEFQVFAEHFTEAPTVDGAIMIVAGAVKN